MNKKFYALLLLSFFSFLCCNAFANDAPIDQIVAVVNDDVITQSELNHQLQLTKLQMQQQQVSMPSNAVLRQKVLETIINKKIQLQMAKQVGIETPESALDKAISGIAKENNLTNKELYEQIRKEGLSTADYRNELRDQITVQKLQQQEVVSRINISQDEVTNFLNSDAWVNNSSKEYHIEDILIPVGDSPSPEELAKAKGQADEILNKIHAGTSFHTLAQAQSNDAIKGGDLGWRSLAELPSAFSDQAVKMKKHEVAGPIQSANGFHIIQMVDVRSSGNSASTPDRKQIENLLLQRKFEEAVQSWVSKIRAQAYVKLEKA